MSSNTEKLSVSQLWALINSHKLTAEEQSNIHERIRLAFMNEKQKSTNQNNCRLQGKGGSACIGSILATDFIHAKGDKLPLTDIKPVETSRAELLNQRQLDRFSDTAGLLGSAAKAKPCEFDTPYARA
jgi:hypothetical protein